MNNSREVAQHETPGLELEVRTGRGWSSDFTMKWGLRPESSEVLKLSVSLEKAN